MELTIRIGHPSQTETPLLVVPLCQDVDGRVEARGKELAALDGVLGGTVGRAVSAGDFRAGRGEVLLLYRQGGEGPERVVLVGAGERGELSTDRLREIGCRAAELARDLRTPELTAVVSRRWLGAAVEVEDAARAWAEGLMQGDWRFEELRSEGSDGAFEGLVAASVLVVDPATEASAAAGARAGRIVGAAQNYARGLAVRPANIVNPRYLADEAKSVGKRLDLDVSILDRKAIEKERMGALLAVAAGSDQEPRFIVMEYRGRSDGAPLVLVGKGVTFDSGGLSLKPAKSMETMKYDMSGAAAVLGAMRAIAELQLPERVVGLIPAVENLPSAHATRPGDVVVSHSGTTVEVLNTDAEGRLILADALSYAARYEPAAVVDIATLTGACVVALGEHAIGLMGNDEGLIDELRQAGRRSGEAVWELPLWDAYREQLKSEIADIKNTGGRPAGAITAAMFLREFVGEFPWAHLDIAGSAWAEVARPGQPKGPTGVGVRLLTEWVRGRAH